MCGRVCGRVWRCVRFRMRRRRRRRIIMGKKKGPKIISEKDARKRHNNYMEEQKARHMKKAEREKALKKRGEEALVRAEERPGALFFSHNTQLGPPYYVLMDTNFINFSIQNKLEIVASMMDCLLAKCIPCITDCVLGELEKLGPRYRLSQRIAKDPRFERLTCSHQGTYADDCLVRRVEMHRCYIVATNDKDLRRRVRRIPGVPIMFVEHHKYNIERLPEAYGAPK